MKTRQMAKKIRDAILADVTDRRDWDSAWDGFDPEIQKEIKSEWLALITSVLEQDPK